MKRLALVISGTLLGLLACELVLRWTTPAEDRPITPLRIEHGRWAGHPFLPFTGVPSAEYTLDDRSESSELRLEHVKNNAYGFRSHEFPADKHAGDYFIVCLGGSTTYGRRVASNAATWPELLERKLAERYPGKRIRAFNMGLDRATTAVSVVNMALVAAHLEPDLVIVYQGYNDLAALGAADHKTDHAHFYADFHPEGVWRGVQHSLPRWLLASYTVSRVAYAVDRLLALNDLAAEIGKPRVQADDRFAGIETTLGNLETIHSIADGAGAEVLFSTFQFRDGDDPVYQRLNVYLRDFFAANGYDYVDQAALIPDHDPTINTDVCHFTDRGRELLAENFYRHIVALGLVR